MMIYFELTPNKLLSPLAGIGAISCTTSTSGFSLDAQRQGITY
jgi:hypothetical protein